MIDKMALTGLGLTNHEITVYLALLELGSAKVVEIANKCKLHRPNVYDALQKLIEKGVQSKAYFFPCIHLQPFYRKQFNYWEGSYPIAEKLSRETFILPLYIELTIKEINQVKQALQESLGELQK